MNELLIIVTLCKVLCSVTVSLEFLLVHHDNKFNTPQSWKVGRERERKERRVGEGRERNLANTVKPSLLKLQKSVRHGGTCLSSQLLGRLR